MCSKKIKPKTVLQNVSQTQIAVTANNFLEYFKILEGTTLPEDPYPELDEESIFEELGNEIVFEEIRSAVKTRKTKSLVALT